MFVVEKHMFVCLFRKYTVFAYLGSILWRRTCIYRRCKIRRKPRHVRGPRFSSWLSRSGAPPNLCRYSQNVYGLGLQGCRVQGIGFRVQGLGFRDQGLGNTSCSEILKTSATYYTCFALLHSIFVFCFFPQTSEPYHICLAFLRGFLALKQSRFCFGAKRVSWFFCVFFALKESGG